MASPVITTYIKNSITSSPEATFVPLSATAHPLLM